MIYQITISTKAGNESTSFYVKAKNITNALKHAEEYLKTLATPPVLRVTAVIEEGELV
jgi:hypothetical protein